MKKNKLYTTIAIVLIIASGVLFGLIFVVPFLPLTTAQKGIVATVLLVGMEVSWWVGAAILGKQVISKYSKFLNPRSWFSGKNNEKKDNETP